MIIEVYGIAGSGKSTWVKKQNGMKKVRVSLLLKIRVLIRMLTRDLIPILRLASRFRESDKHSIVFFIFYKMNAAELLARSEKQNLVYDQGPIYNLSRLHYKSSQDEQERSAREIIKLLERIRQTYDQTVYLRCPVDLVLGRIHNREKEHFARRIDEQEARQRLGRWEDSYEFIHEQLQSTVIENY
jgi:thymidylate kinase